jgi:uncharacterized short protein YbdD (DUF466 family)
MRTRKLRADRRTGGQWLRSWGELVSTLRRVAGMPDYQRHLAHLRDCHPDAAIPTEREYFEQFLQLKSGGSGGRCC